MNKNKYFSLIEKIETIETLEDFFTKYEPKFGEKIKVRRFLKNLKNMKAEYQDLILVKRLRKIKIKESKLNKKDKDLLKTLDVHTLNNHIDNIKRENSLPLILRLMERVNASKK
tara:strand:- start:124 stop:465 length:342 start_codon:yes stop_codon:yes gene_type:complete